MLREKLIMACVGDRTFIRVACSICNVDCLATENEEEVYRCEECESRIKMNVLAH